MDWHVCNSFLINDVMHDSLRHVVIYRYLRSRDKSNAYKVFEKLENFWNSIQKILNFIKFVKIFYKS